jgi:hypothetical protein
MTKRFKGSIRFGRPRGNIDPVVTIDIEENISGIQFLEVEMEPAAFAEALVGNTSELCMFTIRGTDKIGWTSENKTEIVFVPDGERKDKKRIDKALAAYEVDGWSARRSDCDNMHTHVSKDPPKGKQGRWHRVVFHRHVPPNEDKVTQ